MTEQLLPQQEQERIDQHAPGTTALLMLGGELHSNLTDVQYTELDRIIKGESSIPREKINAGSKKERTSYWIAHESKLLASKCVSGRTILIESFQH